MLMKTMMMVIWRLRWCIPNKGMLIGERKLVAISLTSTALTSRELTVIGIIRWALRIWDDSIHNIFNLEARLKKEITFILSVHTPFSIDLLLNISIMSNCPDLLSRAADLIYGELARMKNCELATLLLCQQLSRSHLEVDMRMMVVIMRRWWKLPWERCWKLTWEWWWWSWWLLCCDNTFSSTAISRVAG